MTPNRIPTCIALLFLLLSTPFLFADGEGDNNPEEVRQIPRPGVEVPEEQAAQLRDGIEKLGQMLDQIQANGTDHAKSLIPDVEIYHRGVKDNLEHNEFFNPNDIKKALALLEKGKSRAESLLKGEAPWTQATGLIVRGYRSKLDGSAQPYGLVIPVGYNGTPTRLDIWFHGRGETLSETNFIDQRAKNAGQYQLRDGIVLHPYGRYSNAFKFAGEVDVIEAMQHVQQQYSIDDDRISVRGFSMGGAACWQFAVHYSDQWFAANPGAGFSETPEFLDFFQKETLKPYWWEEKLWHMYDCDDWAINLIHCPTVAYSGENDIQKQAADVMETAMAKINLNLLHLIGPKTGHSIHPDAKKEIAFRMDGLAKTGREDPRSATEVNLVTYTLKYNRMLWITIDRMQQHWERARVSARVRDSNRILIECKNVDQLTVNMPSGTSMLHPQYEVTIAIAEIGGEPQVIQCDAPESDLSFKVTIHRSENGKWAMGAKPVTGFAKTHNLQGPVDDAFMDSFIMVLPTGVPLNDAVSEWATREQEHAIAHWRQHFRGHARVKKDIEVTGQDMLDHNLILWGDPGSNGFIRKLLKDLPLTWTAESVGFAGKTFDSKTHAPIMIYPNPLNPKRYIVINSGFTYREYAYLNNARQVSMIPDYAIVDFATKPEPNDSIYRFPGIPKDANFFDENWQLKP